MAGDWLKFDKSTPDKPEVFEIAGALEIDPDAVVGKLLRVWSWFDSHTDDGNAPVTVEPLLDRLAGVPGFVKATIAVGWLLSDGKHLRISNFERHNGETAKTRALGKNRTQKHRSGSNAKRDAKGNAPPVTDALPEKRREENVIPPNPQGGMGEEDSHRVLPKNWRQMPLRTQKVTRCFRNSPMMERIGRWFGRGKDTIWTVHEAGLLTLLAPSLAEIDLLEEFYLAQIDAEKDYRRRNLATLLNNWSGELDRARIWKAENP